MNRPDITAVIPFYNVNSELFTNCIQSIFSQSYESYEVIVVDDGSDQKYYDFLESIKNMDPRIQIIHKENGGVSEARNYGTNVANGEYITYVDADDILHVDFFKQAIDLIKNNNADFIIGAIKKYDVSEIEELKQLASKTNNDVRYKIYKESEVDSLVPHLLSSNQFIKFDNGGFINRGPVARLLKTEVARTISFPLGIPLGEDIIWNQKILEKSNQVIIVENEWYYYIQNNESAVHKYRKDAVSTVNKAATALMDIIDLNNDEIYKAFCSKLLADLRSIIFQNCWFCKENPDGIITKFHSYLKIKHIKPWNIITFRYFKIGNVKEKIFYLFYRSNLLFFATPIIDKISMMRRGK